MSGDATENNGPTRERKGWGTPFPPSSQTSPPLPSSVKLSEIVAHGRVKVYLNNLHATMWGRPFDIVRPDTRGNCEQFIVDLLKELGFVETQD